MKVLITGVAGFVGSRFAQWLLEEIPGVEVHGWDNLSGGYADNVPNGVSLTILHVENVIPTTGGFDHIYHFAAYAAEVLSPFIRRYNYANNLLATANLITASINGLLKPGGRFVYASSAAVYGNGKRGTKIVPFSEYDQPHPNDPYGVAKLACEQDLRIAGEQHGIDYCVLRLHNIYGEGQNIWDRYRNVFGLWMRAALEGQEAVIYGDGQQQRAFTYIDDILPCLWRAAVGPSASRQIINLGGSQPMTIGQASQSFTEVLEGANSVPPRFRFEPSRHESLDVWCTPYNGQNWLGYKDKTGLYEGLTRMWLWAREAWEMYPNRRNQPNYFAIETTKGLPQSWQ